MQKILIIEDEQEIADTLEYAISSEGMQALWVSSGSAAEQALHEQSIHLCMWQNRLAHVKSWLESKLF